MRREAYHDALQAKAGRLSPSFCRLSGRGAAATTGEVRPLKAWQEARQEVICSGIITGARPNCQCWCAARRHGWHGSITGGYTVSAMIS